MPSNIYIKPDKNRTLLSDRKQMEYNIDYKKQLDFIEYLSKKYNTEFNIYGSFNTDLHRKDSDIDIRFFSINPYVLYTNIKNEVNYRKLMKRTYKYDMPCEGNRCKGISTYYKINFLYHNVELSISIVDIKDKNFFIGQQHYNNIIMYYFGFILKLLKYLFYELKVISKSIYKKCKHLIFENHLIINYKSKYTNDDVLYSN